MKKIWQGPYDFLSASPKEVGVCRYYITLNLLVSFHKCAPRPHSDGSLLSSRESLKLKELKNSFLFKVGGKGGRGRGLVGGR